MKDYLLMFVKERSGGIAGRGKFCTFAADKRSRWWDMVALVCCDLLTF